MPDFSKLANYLDSFDVNHKDYPAVLAIKAKIAADLTDQKTVNNAEDTELGDNDVTMATPEQQSASNHEGELMHGSFKELEALNEIQKEKEEVKKPEEVKKRTFKQLFSASSSDFPGVGQVHNQTSKLGEAKPPKTTVFDLLRKKLKK